MPRAAAAAETVAVAALRVRPVEREKPATRRWLRPSLRLLYDYCCFEHC